jgi:peptidoglycan lytic transglycosylase G
MPVFGRGDDDRQRTAAEREAARLERERRRAEREGRTPPENLPATDEPRAPVDADRPADPAPFGADRAPLDVDRPAADRAPLDVDRPAADRGSLDADAPANGTPPLDETIDEPSWEPFAHEPDPEPIASAREPADDPFTARREREDPAPSPPDAEEPPDWPASDPLPDGSEPDAQHTQPLEPVASTSGRRTVSLPRPQTEDPGDHTDSWDRPIGTVRRSRAGYQAQPGAPGMPPHRNIGVPSKTRRRWTRRFVALLAVLVLAGIAVFAVMLFQPFHGKGYDAVVVTISPGSSTREIGDLLAKKGIVDSGFFFAIRARLGGDRGKLRAGTYTLKKSTSYGDALAALTATPKSAPTIDITLPEGPSRGELAARVKAAGVRGSYVTASERSGLLDPRAYGAPKGTRGLEGFLFPDTYQLTSRTATAKRLVNEQLKTFKREFAKVDLKRAKRRNLSRYDVLIVASMIEREALVPKDQRLISAVIHNRLRRGMPLGIDATLRYRLKNWSSPLKQSELNTRSAYNTRKVQGLPPTPIGNPGLAALQAAANPANVGYLFYVVKPCGNGAHAFSSTDAQFQKDVTAYNRARDKLGGKDPSHAKNC